MVRLAFLRASSTRGSGGLEKYTHSLIEAFQKERFSCSLLTTGHVKSTSFDVVSLLPKKKWFSFLQLLSFDRAAKSYLAKYPHEYTFGLDRNFVTQTFYRAGNGCHAAYLDHRKQFSSLWKRLLLRINPLHWLIKKMEKKTFESCSILFVNSHLVKNDILHYYPNIASDKISVIHNGVSWQKLEEPFEGGFSQKEELCRKFGLNKDAYQFLFVGNEYKRKGLELLLEALSTIEVPFELSVLGKEKNIAYFNKKALDLGLEGKVHFFSEVSNPIDWYKVADCLVVPSYYDPFANVTGEGLAMGLYVVSAPCNGGSEIIEHEYMGDVFSSYTKESLRASLEKALLRPKTYSEALIRRKSVAYLDFSFVLSSYVSKVRLHIGQP